MAFQTVAQVHQIPDGQGRSFIVEGKPVAVFHQGDRYFAMNDLCPHMGASLAEGYLEDGGVTCPWHAWRFCVKDGLWLDNPKSKIRTECYAARVVGTEIQVDVSAPPADAIPT